MATTRSILVSLLFTILTTCNAIYQPELNVNFLDKNLTFELDSLNNSIEHNINGHRHGHKGGHDQGRKDSRGKVVVALDGSGDYRSINEAVDAARGRSSEGRFEIYVKKGRYNEYVQIPEDAKDITLVGDGIGNTLILGNKHAGQDGVRTSTSATFSIQGDGFIAKGIAFLNTAGHIGQAVALSSHADKVAFYKCAFVGYQDTLYLSNGKHFFRECDIYGSMDMICGDAAAIFQNCNIHLRPHNGSQIVVTAQKRESLNDPSGFVIQNSRLIRSEELKRVKRVRVFLGRPWGKHSRTVYIKSFFDGVDPLGWEEMAGNKGGGDVYYGEYGNYGEGADTKGRVGWSGVKRMGESEAREFTVRRFIDGESWLSGSEIPYDLDL